MNSIDVAILSCNSGVTLEKCLRSVKEAAAAYPGHVDVVHFDDQSEDKTVAISKSLGIADRILSSPSRQGFPCAANQTVTSCQSDYVFLINADVILDPGCLKHLVASMTDPRVFACAPFAVLSDGRTVDMARCVGRMKRGWFTFSHVENAQKAGHTLYVSGGYIMLKRDAFLDLGGFSPIYSPGYWEDLDLCYRAWKTGWLLNYNPEAKVTHEKGHVFKKIYTSSQLTRLKSRNRFLFMWKNLDPDTLRAHFAWLPLKLAKSIITAKPGFVRAFTAAVAKAGPVKSERAQLIRSWKRTDREIEGMLVK